jgi:predicted pyridoxine 5'-phosphate oxidase superfamily flavin-nucleotide-binding protein
MPHPQQPLEASGQVPAGVPGSDGEHRLQEQYGTQARARAFYDHQMLDRLSASMCGFIARQAMLFIATADGHGECDCSFRAGPPGFVQVLGPKTLLYPEYRGNGVLASLGNIAENAHIGMLFVDFVDSTVGLHVNGRAAIVENDDLDVASLPDTVREALAVTGGRTPERWVAVAVEEAYIHCSKHVPALVKFDKTIHWGTDDRAKKGGDYFRVKHAPRPWRTRTRPAVAHEGPARPPR